MSTPIDLLGIPKSPKSGPASTVHVSNSVTNGTVGQFAKCFNLIFERFGNAITYVQDAVAGDSFIINIPGVYSISYSGNSGANDIFAITRDGDPTVVATSLPNGVALAIDSCTAADTPANCAWTGYCNANSRIRAHQAGNTSGTLTGYSSFTITLVSPT